MPKILLVDDDEYYRGALKAVLKNLEHDVTEAEDGKSAQHALTVQAFDVVISDIRMPGMSGVQLLAWIKTTTKTPVVLMTGFSEIMETHQASQLGADGFLLKPFDSKDIDGMLSTILGPKTENKKTSLAPGAPQSNLDAQYRKIPIEDFVSGSKIHFSIFIRVSSTHYVRIAYQGEDLVVDSVRAYKTKGVTHLYMTREDFGSYVSFNLTLAKAVGAARQISPEKKRNFIRYTAEVVLEHVFVEGADRAEFDSAKELVTTVLDVVQHHNEIFALLEALNSHADFLYAHSLGVSVYSSLIAKGLGWHSTPVQFKVSLAGLLHDIGLKEIARPIIEKARLLMSQEERSEYETHPARGMQLLSQIRGMPDDIALISAHHHEDAAGSGYPLKIKKSKIHPLARVVAVADIFCECAIKGPDRMNVSAAEAIAYMSQNRGFAMDPACFGALRKIFGV